MADSESIRAIESIETHIDLLNSFCLAVHDANPCNAPAWVAIVIHHTQEIYKAIEASKPKAEGAAQ